MRVTQQTAGELVIEEGAAANLLIGLVCTGIGAVGILIGLFRGELVVVLITAVLLFYGLKTLLSARTKTHRFDRARRLVAIESKGRFGTTQRELPFDTIADVVLEKVPRSHSYYVYYVTRQGERLRWADSYDGSPENTVNAFNVAREWLGMEKRSTEAL
jgi:hypothetical protein